MGHWVFIIPWVVGNKVIVAKMVNKVIVAKVVVNKVVVNKVVGNKVVGNKMIVAEVGNKVIVAEVGNKVIVAEVIVAKVVVTRAATTIGLKKIYKVTNSAMITFTMYKQLAVPIAALCILLLPLYSILCVPVALLFLMKWMTGVSNCIYGYMECKLRGVPRDQGYLNTIVDGVYAYGNKDMFLPMAVGAITAWVALQQDL